MPRFACTSANFVMVATLLFAATATADSDKAFIATVDGNLQLSAAPNRSVIVEGVGDLAANLTTLHVGNEELRTANDELRAMLHAVEVNLTQVTSLISTVATLVVDVTELRAENTELRAENTELRRSLTSLSFTTTLLLDHVGLNTTNTTTPPAPTPGTCAYSEYSDYSLCSALCDGGTQGRSRNVTVDIPGLSCNGTANLVDTRSCNTHACAVDCVLGAPGNWSECSATCGGGQKFRFRPILMHPQNGGVACPSLVDTTSCNTQVCLTTICPGGVFTTASSLQRLKECDFIAGDVVLSGMVDVIVLSDFMGNVTQINGTLRGFSAVGITSFGLMNLTHITSNFEMINMDGLTDFAGLEKVVVIGGDFILDDCRSLVNITGLGVTSIGGKLDVKNMPAMTTLGLANLTEIAGDFTLSDGPQKMELLVSIAFSRLSTTSGFSITISFTRGMELLAVMSFPALTSTSSFTINVGGSGLYVLTTISFPVLMSTSAFIIYAGSSGMADLTTISFPDLVSTSSFSISTSSGGMAQLTTMSFPVLMSTSSFSISSTHIGGMQRLATISFPALSSTSSFSISAGETTSMMVLTTISFPVLTSTSTFSISATVSSSMPALSTLYFPALSSAASFSIASSATAPVFPSLLSLFSFNNLTRVSDGQLFLSRCDSLTSISGFTSLSRAHSLRMEYLPALTTIQALTSLQTIDNSLIVQNTALASVDFLSSVTSIGTTTSITSNSRLALCQSLQSSLQSATAGTTTISGYGSLDAC